jgi:hypothetical protein|tara:strand:+ start:180 stop:437 length:258 start_codon:yes stop_codon:yes gene_type:complete
MKNIIFTIIPCILLVLFLTTSQAFGQAKPKSKFYDFGAQIIDGEIKKPTALYTDSKKKVKFDRLLRLKKTFIPELMNTSKERTFK